jgi:hypothetical protein
MANNNKNPLRIGELLWQQGYLQSVELERALQQQRRCGESLGTILVNNGAISHPRLIQTLVHQRILRLLSLTCTLLLAPTAWAGSEYRYSDMAGGYEYAVPSADRPPIYEGQPISVPVKALIERLAFGVTESSYQSKKFRYDIDTLGQGMALRLRIKF